MVRCYICWKEHSVLLSRQFHSFPSDAERREKWFNTIGYTVDTYKNARICSELLEPWNAGSTQSRFFMNIDDGPKTIKMQTLYGRCNETASLRLTLDPECSYAINIQPSGINDKISCRIWDRWLLLYLAIISLLLLFVSIRIHSSDMLPTVIVTIVLSFFFNVAYEACIALCIISISVIAVCCCVIFLGSVAHGITVKFLAITFSTTWSDWLLNGLNELPFIINSIGYTVDTYKNARICSDHFTEDDYYYTGTPIPSRRFKKTAIPSVFTQRSCRSSKKDTRSNIQNNQNESLIDIEYESTMDIQHQSAIDVQQSTIMIIQQFNMTILFWLNQ